MHTACRVAASACPATVDGLAQTFDGGNRDATQTLLKDYLKQDRRTCSHD